MDAVKYNAKKVSSLASYTIDGMIRKKIRTVEYLE